MASDGSIRTRRLRTDAQAVLTGACTFLEPASSGRIGRFDDAYIPRSRDCTTSQPPGLTRRCSRRACCNVTKQLEMCRCSGMELLDGIAAELRCVRRLQFSADMIVTEYFDKLRGKIVGRPITDRQLAGNSLSLWIDTVPGDTRVGLTIWLDPAWNVIGPDRVLAGSMQARMKRMSPALTQSPMRSMRSSGSRCRAST